jgi:hypothetical protein
MDEGTGVVPGKEFVFAEGCRGIVNGLYLRTANVVVMVSALQRQRLA